MVAARDPEAAAVAAVAARAAAVAARAAVAAVMTVEEGVAAVAARDGPKEAPREEAESSAGLVVETAMAELVMVETATAVETAVTEALAAAT